MEGETIAGGLYMIGWSITRLKRCRSAFRGIPAVDVCTGQARVVSESFLVIVLALKSKRQWDTTDTCVLAQPDV